jgi:hypothetical protein
MSKAPVKKKHEIGHSAPAGQYLFKTSDFGVSDAGIHLLRNEFNYLTIPWDEINSLKIEKGKVHHNWFLVFLLGTVILIPGLYVSMKVVETLFYEEISRAYRMMTLFFFPCLGVHIIWNSLKTGLLLRIRYSFDKKDMFPLKEIIQGKKLNEFKSLLNHKLNATKRSLT